MTSRLLQETEASQLAATLWADSHGAFDSHLGAGHLYYALGSIVRSQVSVCIGSGAGFVPRIMAKAQDDLGIDNARTFLVDANLADLAFGSPMQMGGWLSPENDFLATSPRVTVLNMLSVDAAALFTQAGITIDYLHIDGDHSKRGVIADIEDYLPLVSPGGIITLHDLRAEGVRTALDEAQKRFPDLERLSFFEIGAGTAIIRLKSETMPPRLRLGIDPGYAAQRVTAIAPEVIAAAVAPSLEKAKFERWHYLNTETYRLRYTLVSREIDRAGGTVVELGGFPNSVVDSLSATARVFAIEPYAPAAYVAHAEASARERGIALHILGSTIAERPLPIASLGRYAFVAMGLDISQGFSTEQDVAESLDHLIELIGGAEIAAIEIPDYKPSQATFEAVQACIERETLYDVRLDLTADPVAQEYYVLDGRARRRIILFRPKRTVPPALRASILRPFVDRLFKLKQAASSPENRKYELGQTILFTQEGEMQRYRDHGWGALERDKTWMIDRVSTLMLNLEDTLGDDTSPLVLTVDLKMLVLPGHVERQALSIAINDQQIYEGSLAGDAVLDIEIPYEIVARHPRVTISFHHPDGVRPVDCIAGSADGRLLSFAVRSMRLSRAEVIAREEAPAL